MRLADIINGPWMITENMLNEIKGIYAIHMRGEKIDIAAVEARIGKPLQNPKQAGYEVINGTAIIPVEGVISKKMNLFSQISGGMSSQLIERDITAALADPSVEQILLSFDSPGGTVDGSFELANFIYESRGQKPIYAHTDGMMLSAAYLIASAADQIYISPGGSSEIGHIGVRTTHTDTSKRQEIDGVKTTDIYVGKYKVTSSQNAPLSEEGKQIITDRLDYMFTMMVDNIAKYRGVSSEKVLSTMATTVKDYFIGNQALEAGLVDGVSTLSGLINKTGGVPVKEGFRTGRIDKTKKEVNNMTKDELKKEHPDVYQAIMDESKTSMTAGIEQAKKEGIEEGMALGKTQGAEAEKARIAGIEEYAVAGMEDIITAAKADGKSTGADVAMQILKRQKETGVSLAAIKHDATSAKHVAAGAEEATVEDKGFDSLVTEHMEAKKCTRGKAIEAVAKSNPAEHQAWLATVNTKKEVK